MKVWNKSNAKIRLRFHVTIYLHCCNQRVGVAFCQSFGCQYIGDIVDIAIFYDPPKLVWKQWAFKYLRNIRLHFSNVVSFQIVIMLVAFCNNTSQFEESRVVANWWVVSCTRFYMSNALKWNNLRFLLKLNPWRSVHLLDTLNIGLGDSCKAYEVITS